MAVPYRAVPFARWIRNIAYLSFIVATGCAAGNSTSDAIAPNERLIGRAIHHHFAARPGFVLDPQTTNYCADLLTRLRRAYPGHQPQAFTEAHLVFLDSGDTIIGSVPTGEIFISVGAVRQLTTEAALSFVVAHELGHLAHQHHRLLREDDATARRDAEIDADRFAIGLIALAGWNPILAPETVHILSRGVAAYSKHSDNPDTNYPPVAERITALHDELSNSGWLALSQSAPGLVSRRDYYAFRQRLLAKAATKPL